MSGGRSSFTGVPESEDLQKVVAWSLDEILNVHTVVLLVRAWSLFQLYWGDLILS